MDNKTLAIIAFILAFFVPLAGLIIGIIALVQSGKSNGEGKGFAIAAIIISLILPILIFIGSIAYFGALNPAVLLPE